MSAEPVAYAICRHCAAVFHAGRRCPHCDGDVAAGEAIAAATAHALEPAVIADLRARAARPHRILVPLVGVTALMLGLGVGLAWLIVHESSPGDAAAATTSSIREADR